MIALDIQIVDNFSALFNTGIPEIKEIVSELVVMLPLKSKNLITLCKSRIITPLMVNSLCSNDSILLSKIILPFLIIIFLQIRSRMYHLFFLFNS